MGLHADLAWRQLVYLINDLASFFVAEWFAACIYVIFLSGGVHDILDMYFFSTVSIFTCGWGGCLHDTVRYLHARYVFFYFFKLCVLS